MYFSDAILAWPPDHSSTVADLVIATNMKFQFGLILDSSVSVSVSASEVFVSTASERTCSSHSAC
jgi:hypothetical protein